VKLVVVVDADHARGLRPHKDIERDTRRLEPIDHPDPMGVAGGVTTRIIRLDHTTGSQVLDAFDRVADEVGQLFLAQARG
jgi:hypothetical protein